MNPTPAEIIAHLRSRPHDLKGMAAAELIEELMAKVVRRVVVEALFWRYAGMSGSGDGHECRHCGAGRHFTQAGEPFSHKPGCVVLDALAALDEQP